MGRSVGSVSPTPDRRAEIVRDAIQRIGIGESTAQIGASHGVTGAAVRLWLVSDAKPEADQARSTYLTERLLEAIDAIDAAQDGIALARAREQFRAWSFFAERRAPALFGVRREIAITDGRIDLPGALAAARAALQGRVIDVTPTIPAESEG